jgi:peptide/nickel transport system substrate-binding protein
MPRTRFRYRPAALGLGLAAVTTALVSACGTSTTPAASTSSTAAGGTLNWEWQLPTSWDPVESTAGWDVHALSLVYSAITRLDAKGNAVPGLASKWAYSPDGTSITFTLRPGLKFSDGTVLDASAVKASLLRGRDEPDSKIASQLAEVSGIDVTNPTTFVLHLTQVDYQIPNLLAGKTGMVVSPKAFGSNATALATHPVGDGPFTLTSYVPDSQASLVRNPGYYDAADIHLAKANVKLISEPQQVLAALQSKQVNVAVIPGSLVKAAQSAGFTINQVPALTTNTLDVNSSIAPFNNHDVILAINYAIDRQALVNALEFGYGTPTYQPFPKGYVGYDPSLADLYPHDVAKAKQLLAAAGYAKGLTISLTTATATGIPELLQSQLQQAGITVKLNVIPEAQFTNLVYVKKSVGIAVDSTAGRESPLQMLDVLQSKQGLMNLTAQGSAPVQAAVAAARAVPLDSPKYPAALLAAVDASVKQDDNHIWLYSYPRILATSKDVSGLPYDLVVQRFDGTRIAN